ncbi:hypothetical protein CP061683_0968A, partial [Chlamydia psittaci 06-1683]
MTALIVTVLL